jgi:RAQPRD family integrative conjugative element protein
MKKLKPLLLVSALLLPTAVTAEIWAEREALSKVESELSDLESLVLAAKSRSNPEDRTTFDYTALLSDLATIRAGIRTHLSVPMEPVLPSTINALEGNYTEHQK